MQQVSTIYERILIVAKFKGFKNAVRLAAYMGYGNGEKLYRLKRDPQAKPAYDMIEDFANKFSDLNMRWFVTGQGKPFEVD